jgi:hypothetical protein
VIECDATSLADYPDALIQLADGALDAVLVRGLYSPEQIDCIAARLEHDDIRCRLSARDYADSSRRQVEVIGEPISPSDAEPSGPDPETYFAGAGTFRQLCQELFAPATSFVQCSRDVLSALGGERAARQLHHPDGRSYGSATLRRVPVGCGMGLHCENLYRDIPIFEPVKETVRLDTTMSFIMPLVCGEAGGLVTLYGEQPPTDDEASSTLDPGAGDLLIFAAGARYHRVTTVEGSRARWTIGGFVAYGYDDDVLWLWG